MCELTVIYRGNTNTKALDFEPARFCSSSHLVSNLATPSMNKALPKFANL